MRNPSQTARFCGGFARVTSEVTSDPRRHGGRVSPKPKRREVKQLLKNRPFCSALDKLVGIPRSLEADSAWYFAQTSVIEM